MIVRRSFTGLTVFLVTAACGGGDAPAGDGAENTAEEASAGSPCANAPETLMIEVTYSPEVAVDLGAMECSASGLHWRTLAEGDGAEAADGDTVHVHYTGRLPDGSTFDSSRGGDPYSFALGQGRVIEGWDEGLRGMRVGGRRVLVIPPHLGYGSSGAGGVIPPDATLVFEVELVEVVKPNG